MNTRLIGKRGEDIAADFLAGKGYLILERNYWAYNCEIDIIAQKDDIIVFIEVKARNGNIILPRESVNKKKQLHIVNAANEFICSKLTKQDLFFYRFDIIEIYLNLKKIIHLVDAFEAT